MNIPVVIVAYNRPASLTRLLGSISRAKYPKKIKLIISIDGGPGNEETARVARDFHWAYGSKEVIVHEKKLGLRAHVLACGDLSARYGAVLILEDDLYVSPYYYDYAVKAAGFYKGDDGVAGVSLFSHGFNETAGFPFMPLDDGSDVFFMQVPSSWGQCWTAGQWSAFRKWKVECSTPEGPDRTGLPPNSLQWTGSSWKIFFLKYLVDSGKFFVYPRHSLTTNFGDYGTHQQKNRIFQVPLLYGERSFRFVKSRDSLVKYDCYCEMLPECLGALNPALSKYDFSVDLYGMKSLSVIPGKYVLTSKKCSSPVHSYGMEMLPLESGIIGNLAGDDLFLARKTDCADTGEFNKFRYRKNIERKLLEYHYAMMPYTLSVLGAPAPIMKASVVFDKIRRYIIDKKRFK